VLHAHLFSGEQAPGSQPAVAALEIECLTDMRDLLQAERLILARAPSSLIQNLCDRAVKVVI
jgi:hypothetical protein